MTTSTRTASPDTGSGQAYLLYGRTFTNVHDPRVQHALHVAHADHLRPLCLCRPEGVEMYVAKIADQRFVIKRMPQTGLDHTPACPSYLPPEELSGLGQVLGSAITDTEGLTALKFGFRMSKTERPSPKANVTGEDSDSVTADPNKLTLRSVLHYLWQEAQLTTWTPNMTGRRNWRVVSWHLRTAAHGKFNRGKPLNGRLFIPEPFAADKKAEIEARRLKMWDALRQPGQAQNFMLILGELKSIEPARFGHRLVIKHLPGAPVMIDDTLLSRLNRRFADELELWEGDSEGHLMLIATVSIGRTGLAHAEEVSLVMTDRHWLPYETAADKMLLDSALDQQRRFSKSLRYNLPSDAPMASLVFTDTANPTAAFITFTDRPADLSDLASSTHTTLWSWDPTEPLPALPPKRVS